MPPASLRTRSVVVLATVAVLAACSAGPSAVADHGRLILSDAKFPVALIAEGDGLLYAERLTGRVRHLAGNGELQSEPVAEVPVSTAGQRGLLGVARDDAGRVFVAFTATGPGRKIQVAQVVPSYRPVWEGPASSNLANGGHLVWDGRRGRLILGVGDLEQRRLVADPSTPNGKLLLLDPDGDPGQVPEVLSAGWNNPFAFTLTSVGELWVADNVPGQRGERLARGDRDGRPTRVTQLPENTVPSALAAYDDRTLMLCSFARSQALRYELRDGVARSATGFGDGLRCATGLAADADGLWSAELRTVRRLDRSR